MDVGELPVSSCLQRSSLPNSLSLSPSLSCLVQALDCRDFASHLVSLSLMTDRHGLLLIAGDRCQDPRAD